MNRDENTETWIETVKTAQRAGLDRTIPRRVATTPAERDLKQKTNIILSRRVFGVPALPWKEEGRTA
jgi:2-hydroxychromene-2-carboxylate isomerase